MLVSLVDGQTGTKLVVRQIPLVHKVIDNYYGIMLGDLI